MNESDDEFLTKFLDIIKDAMPDRVVANFIFIAEIISNDNSELSIVTSNGMTPWLAQGMIHSAEDMIINGIDNLGDDIDD